MALVVLKGWILWKILIIISGQCFLKTLKIMPFYLRLDLFLDQSQSWYLVGYWIFVFVLVPYVFFRSWVFLYALLQASRKLHDDLFHAVVNGVTSFFDVVPCGHVISRLSTDTDVLDDQLPEFMEQTISLWLVILSIVLVVSTQYPWFILPLAVLMVAFLFVNEFFRRSSREVQVCVSHYSLCPSTFA